MTEIETKVVKSYEKTKHKKNYKGFYQLVLKRIIDIIACIIILPFILIITIPVAILIKFEDGGPVFYKSIHRGLFLSKNVRFLLLSDRFLN